MPNVLSLQFFIFQVKFYICYHFYLQGDVPLDVPCLRNDYPVVLLDQNRIKEWLVSQKKKLSSIKTSLFLWYCSFSGLLKMKVLLIHCYKYYNLHPVVSIRSTEYELLILVYRLQFKSTYYWQHQHLYINYSI